MIGGLKRTTSHFAIAALASVLVGGVAASPVMAADLGGDCCADLEERVAELEATTVRKGNRNVSVTLYGWVNAGITWFDNGEESDAYVVDMDTAGSRIGVRGSGNIKPGWSAGYRLELSATGDVLSGTSEDDGDDAFSGESSKDSVRLRHAAWWIQSEQLGRITVGQTDGAASGIESIDLGGASTWIAYNGGQDWNFSFSVITAGGGKIPTGVDSTLLWGNVIDDFDRSRHSAIRYETPAIAGFTASASWGEDDRYDVALRYSQEWSGLAVEAGVGYVWDDDDNALTNEEETLLASLSLYHASSGLFGVISYGTVDFNTAGVLDAENWYGKLGWRKNVTGMGETALYGEYGQTDDLFVDGDGVNIAVSGDSASFWGGGIGQDIDAVGGTLYLGYRHYEADLVGFDTEDMDQILAGMVLPF
jgi:predicted porin